ncbi:MAG: GNAT family protein [Rhodospirillaceae bacterium]|nr:GNAT family protein [Rhodospirillaceae bacterium]
MSITNTLETDRLSARPIGQRDVAQLQTLHQKPAVAEHIGGSWTLDRSEQFVRGALEHWRRYGYGQWMFSEKQTGQVVGRSGLRHYYLDAQDEIELLYAFEPDVWGQGYGTEAARAVIDYAFGATGAKSVVSFTLPDNPGSERVMQKAGMVFEKEMMRLDPPAFLVYRLTRKAWDASR